MSNKIITIKNNYSNNHLIHDNLENPIFINEIKKKRSSYKQQDKQKECFDSSFFISFRQILELLCDCNQYCYFCKDMVHILYEKNDPKQWTLDRLDNDYGHNYNNCVICCLHCNIKRGLMNETRFRFTKQLKIIKK